MRILSLLLGTLSLACATTEHNVNPDVRASRVPLLTLHFPATAVLANPQSLPAQTHATLSTANLTLKAIFRRNSTFVFDDIPVGSYLGEVWTGAAGVNTVPLRVDVVGPDGRTISSKGIDRADKKVSIWQTFRANEWDNKGELLGEATGLTGLTIDVQVLNARDVYEPRGGFSPLSLLKNPMILMGIVAMGLMFGMPKLMENMDPEMREEFEKQQRSTGIANALTGQGSSGFDAASWLAGAGSKEVPTDTTSKAGGGKTSSVDSKGGKKRRA